MSRRKGRHNQRTILQKQLSQAARSSRQSGKTIRSDSCRVHRWRKSWVATSGLLIVATLGPVFYQAFNDRKKIDDEKLNNYRLGAVVEQERHGCRTMEVVSADPNENTAKHVDMVVNGSFSNVGTKAIQLTRYAVDVLSNGGWLRLTPIALRHASSLVTHPASQPQGQYTDVRNKCLNDVIWSRALVPGASIGGYMFLTIDDGEPVHHFILEQIRLVAWDIDEREYIIQPKRVGEQTSKRCALRCPEWTLTELGVMWRRRRSRYR